MASLHYFSASFLRQSRALPESCQGVSLDTSDFTRDMSVGKATCHQNFVMFIPFKGKSELQGTIYNNTTNRLTGRKGPQEVISSTLIHKAGLTLNSDQVSQDFEKNWAIESTAALGNLFPYAIIFIKQNT